MNYKKSKFYKRKTFKERARDTFYTIFFWKGRKKGLVRTLDIKLIDVYRVFFPKNFREKYSYLGAVPNDEGGGELFKQLLPLVLTMDYFAKPRWCPRWVLRFLYLFGNDNSVVRIRNTYLSGILFRLTGGIFIWDYKTKWFWYDLRISISGNGLLHQLSTNIEKNYYKMGRTLDLKEILKEKDPSFDEKKYYRLDELEKMVEKFEED